MCLSRRRCSGTFSFTTIKVQEAAALLLQQTGRRPEAIPLLKRAALARNGFSGPGDQGTLRTLHMLADELLGSPASPEALAALPDAIQISRAALGADHELTLQLSALDDGLR
jgi:hypothetical protein